MPKTRSNSMKYEVYDALVEEITSGTLTEGERLSPVREVAERFDTSVCTVHGAMELLKSEGYIRVKRGVGTFVNDTTPSFEITDSVALCMRPHAHLFGPLTRRITNRLLDHHISPLVVDMDREESHGMMRRMARSGVQFFIVHGDQHFPFEVLDDPLFEDKWVVSLLKWYGGERLRLLRVLTDDRAGGAAAARHLWEKGHRHAVVVMPENIEWQLQHQRSDVWGDRPLTHCRGFVEEWEQRGGKWESLNSENEREGDETFVWLKRDRFLQAFDGGVDVPTAVFGFRDVEAVRMQQAIRDWQPQLKSKIDIVGYYDTPWSRAAHPPLSTVSLRLGEVARQAAGLIRAVVAGEDADRKEHMVQPELIVRAPNKS